jgi:hypothetical protein
MESQENLLHIDELPEPSDNIGMPIINIMKAGHLLESPQTIQEALQRPNRDKWLKICHRELRILIANQTWRNIRRKDVKQDHKMFKER